MTSFANAHKQRKYRERLQPTARARVGFLEKREDHAKRAREHHRKEDALKAMRLRAATRNPDEFSFGMIRSRLGAGGRHVALGARDGTPQPDERVLHMLKTQDLGYVRTQRTLNARKLAGLQEEITLRRAAGASIGTHTIFAESVAERDAIAAAQPGGTSSAAPRPEASSGDLLDDLQAEVRPQSAGDEELRQLRREADVRRERVRMLDRMDAKLSLDRHLLRPGRRQKVGTDAYGLAVYRWAPERQK